MPVIVQEALAPDTDAMPRTTIEWSLYRGKHRVRVKDPNGYVVRMEFDDQDAAHRFFWAKADSLKAEKWVRN